MRIGIICGEASGDILGAGLIRELRKRYPNAVFEGIGGSEMIAEGFTSHEVMEKLSVMGLFEVLKHLPEILGIRKRIVRHFLNNPPDIFIGIDSPDFCIPVEKKFKEAGIKTVHYVSPTVWAWRQNRVIKIKKSVDKVLCLFPFESDFYTKFDVDSQFVGHPLADKLPIDPDTQGARESLGLKSGGTYLCMMPGSRQSEIHKLTELFLETANNLVIRHPDVEVLIPVNNYQSRDSIQLYAAKYPQLKIQYFIKKSHEVMAASNAILLASGTAALEALLLKKPMVVSYRVSALTYAIVKRLYKLPYVSLPNILAGRELVPELLQEEATTENLTVELSEYFRNTEKAQHLVQTYQFIHKQLKRNASELAAQAVIDLIEKRS